MDRQALVRRAAPWTAGIWLFLLSSAMGAVEVEVTTCGQTVPHGARGYLAADLDCTGNPGGFFGGAIVLERGAQLDLRGFTLTGDAGGAGVVCGEPCGDQPLSICKSSCKIFGSGGSIVGTGLGIYGNSLDVHDVTITGCTTAIGSLRRLTLRHATISANAAWGIFAPSCKPKIYDSTITDSGSGVNSSYGVLLKHSSVTGNVYGDLLTSRRPKLVDSTCGTSAGAPPSGGTWGVCTLD